MNITVIGAGQGGLATAGHLTLKGHKVTLWNRSLEKLQALKKIGSITMGGVINGTVQLSAITSNLEEAIKGADIISIMITADGYESIAIKMAPYLEDGQKVLLNSAGLGGALLFQATLRGTGYCPKITVAEADNCIYVCRSPEISKSLIKSIKKIICFSVLPLDQAQGFLDVIHNLYPQFQLVDDPLVNGIRHVNAAVHTAGVILNAERIKRKENFNFYTEGITPAIGSYIEMLEKERIAVAEKLGISTQTTRQWLHSV